MNGDVEFVFHWKDGTVDRMAAPTPELALTKLGYGQGALAALDYWEDEDPSDDPRHP